MLNETLISVLSMFAAGLFAREIWLHTQISKMKNDLKWIVSILKNQMKEE